MPHPLIAALLLLAATPPASPAHGAAGPAAARAPNAPAAAPPVAPGAKTLPAAPAPAGATAAPLKPVQAVKAVKPPPPADGLGRTPPAGWAKVGYQQLRWGMGPGDVKDALAVEGGPLTTTEPLVLGEGYDPAAEGGARVAAPGLVVAGHASILGFRFLRGRLTAVALLPAEDPGDPAAWAATLTALLTERYGAPSVTGARTVWARDGLQVALPFLDGWSSSVGWFAPPVTEARPGGAAGGGPSAEEPALAAARKAREAAEQKARAEAEKRAREALKAEAQKL